MGNCCGRDMGSSAVWAGDDWGPITQLRSTEKQTLLAGDHSSAPVREVRIRVTKKQLEELLRRAESGSGGRRRVAVDRAVERLIEKSEILRHPSWRPALQSIPEVE